MFGLKGLTDMCMGNHIVRDDSERLNTKTLQDLQLIDEEVHALLDSDKFVLKKDGFIYTVVDSKSRKLLLALTSISDPDERVNLVLEPVIASQVYVDEKVGEFSLYEIVSSWIDISHVIMLVIRGITSFTYQNVKYTITDCDMPKIWAELARITDEDIDDASIELARFMGKNTWVRRAKE